MSESSSQKKDQATMQRLSRCTGFPVQTLRDFAERGLLPKAINDASSEQALDGLALLRKIGEIEDAE